MTGTIVDMHVHTVRGAADSSLTPDQLIEEARRIFWKSSASAAVCS